jgi:hypothetical protein
MATLSKEFERRRSELGMLAGAARQIRSTLEFAAVRLRGLGRLARAAPSILYVDDQDRTECERLPALAASGLIEPPKDRGTTSCPCDLLTNACTSPSV